MDLPDATRLSSWIFSSDGIKFLAESYGTLRQLFQREMHEGMFEILEYDATLEILDPHGETATFEKRQRVRFLQDFVMTFQDYVWGDGDVLVDYSCSPGVVADRYREGNRWNMLISLRQSKSVGDVEDFYISRKIRRGFTKDEEWWQNALQHRTKWAKLSIVFPKKRHCQKAFLIERIRNRTTPIDSSNFVALPDGRQVLNWQMTKPRRYETYTFKWEW
jgi:hypothetical protein